MISCFFTIQKAHEQYSNIVLNPVGNGASAVSPSQGERESVQFQFQVCPSPFHSWLGANGGSTFIFFHDSLLNCFSSNLLFFSWGKDLFYGCTVVCTDCVSTSPTLVDQESAFRRQSRSSAWSRGDRWGSPPAPAGSPRPRRPWSSHWGWSGTCRCQCHGRWSRFLLRQHTKTRVKQSKDRLCELVWQINKSDLFFRKINRATISKMSLGCHLKWHNNVSGCPWQ